MTSHIHIPVVHTRSFADIRPRFNGSNLGGCGKCGM